MVRAGSLSSASFPDFPQLSDSPADFPLNSPNLQAGSGELPIHLDNFPPSDEDEEDNQGAPVPPTQAIPLEEDDHPFNHPSFHYGDGEFPLVPYPAEPHPGEFMEMDLMVEDEELGRDEARGSECKKCCSVVAFFCGISISLVLITFGVIAALVFFFVIFVN